jgi:hypothetical protein
MTTVQGGLMMGAHVECPMTSAAISGYEAKPNQHLWSSAMWLAHQAGRALGDAGHGKPVYPVKVSRGYSVKCNTAEDGRMLVVFRGKRLDQFEVQMLDRRIGG